MQKLVAHRDEFHGVGGVVHVLVEWNGQLVAVLFEDDKLTIKSDGILSVVESTIGNEMTIVQDNI